MIIVLLFYVVVHTFTDAAVSFYECLILGRSYFVKVS